MIYKPIQCSDMLAFKLFPLANQLYRQKKYVFAYIIYEWLSTRDSSFDYEQSRQICETRLRQVYKNLPKPSPFTYSKKCSYESIDTRLLNILLSVSSRFDRDQFLVLNHKIANPLLALPLRVNLSVRDQDYGNWQFFFSKIFKFYGVNDFSLVTRKGCFSGFSSNNHILNHIQFSEVNQVVPATNLSKLVTVLMSAFNAEKTIDYAIRSVLSQSHSNFELIIVDDASEDRTVEIVNLYAQVDKRIHLYHNQTRRGTYYNRNLGMSIAKGDYFTILDADDFMHPQRLFLQLLYLSLCPKKLAVLCYWFRVCADGEIVFRNGWGGVYSHEAVATLMFRRRPVLSKLGYYDEVKFSADTEYLNRIKKVFGPQTVGVIRKPLTLAASIDSSLTANSKTGIDNYLGMSSIRTEYQNYWSDWHSSQPSNQLFLAIHADKRKFPAPSEML